MKRIRARVEIAWHAAVDFEVEDDLDDEEIQCIAIAAVNRGEWEDDRAEVVSIEIMDEPPASGDLIQEGPGANSRSSSWCIRQPAPWRRCLCRLA